MLSTQKVEKERKSQSLAAGALDVALLYWILDSNTTVTRFAFNMLTSLVVNEETVFKRFREDLAGPPADQGERGHWHLTTERSSACVGCVCVCHVF